MAKPQRYPYAASLELLREIARSEQALDWDQQKQKISGIDPETDQKWSFRFPLPFPVPHSGEQLTDYLSRIPETPAPYLLILIQAGHSAIGYFEEGKALHHKVIKKYMVRAKQGKAQIGYLSTRGKSKAGSRVRLANTVAFFEDINAKITEWDCIDEAERILISVPVRLKPLLFQSKVPPPFNKTDPRLLKIPLDTQKPGLEELQRVNRQILMGQHETYPQ